MDLIIKPTERCNFRCEFCSSNLITNDRNQELPVSKVIDFLKTYPTNTIIVNGGDPLMMPPSYYRTILDYIDEYQLDTTLSFTTNLYDFYLHPAKWIPIFKHKRVGVATSFQFGTQRKYGDGRVFTKKDFLKFMKLFRDRIGYTPMFISVLSDENERYVMDTVKLAKDLNTFCKINPAVQSGRSASFYPLYKAIRQYLLIIRAGYKAYEFNSDRLYSSVHNKNGTCPYCRNCYNAIRTMGPDGKLFSCGSFQDDYYKNENKKRSTYCLEDETAIARMKQDFRYLKKDCLACPLFYLCNSCFKQIDEIKKSNTTAIHCLEMKKLMPELLRL